jgi:di/tricarboxylate transporter
MFDGLDDVDAPRRPGTLFVIGVTVAITVLALGAWAIAAFVRSFDICPDGATEYWHHAPTSSYIPEMLIGVVAVVLLLLILQAATGWAWAFALSATSVGGLIFLLTLEDFLSHTGEPARFRCGESFDATPMAGWAFPGFGLVYVLVLASYLVSRYRSPSRSTSSARG